MGFGAWEHGDAAAAAYDLGEQAGDVGLSRYSFGSKGRLIVASGSEWVLWLAAQTADIVP